MKRITKVLLAMGLTLPLLVGDVLADQPAALPTPLVYLRSLDSTITQDIRYATRHNFTAAVVPGYNSAECVLALPVAVALARVQADLHKEGMALKVYDCYRPQRAVQFFVKWVQQAVNEQSRHYHPNTAKARLLDLGYIARQSGHSRGDAVDLTMIDPSIDQKAIEPTQNDGPCTGAAAERMPDNSVDMGTSFDCFDTLSATKSSGLSALQQQWRRRLVDAMARHGFQNYEREWWHFSFKKYSGPAFDVPIEPWSRSPATNDGSSQPLR